MPNDRVIVNPKYKNNGDFRQSLMSRGKGAKDYPNSHTEVEYLGGGKFAASIGVGHRVFFDKADGNKPKKHKLTDERPGKDYVLVQGAKCCVEVYPYYAKYFDPTHENVRLYEERWVVQRLFKTVPQEEWRDVDAYNPVMELKEEDSRVSVTVTYQTDYGILTVRYAQGDGNNLAHHILFVNESGGTETFRVLQRWAGIVGGKCNEKEIPLNIETPKRFNITNNLHGQLYETIYEKTGRIIEKEVQDPDTGEWSTIQVEETRPVEKRRTEKCLKLPVRIETHAQGMKADFIFERWTLAPTEVLTIGSPYALSFNGISDDVEIPDNASLNITGQITIEVLFKMKAGGVDQKLVNKYGRGLAVFSDNKFEAIIRAEGAWINTRSDPGGAVLNVGEYYYGVGTYDGATLKSYINGVLDRSVAYSGDIDSDSGINLFIGRWHAGSYCFNGIEDEVRISDIARTPEEILANWNNGCGKKLEADEHTVALWHMDEGEGGIIHDESPNGNDGTIHGASWTDGFPFGDDRPDIATLSDPAEDGFVRGTGPPGGPVASWDRITILDAVSFYHVVSPWEKRRGYVEWDISSILGGSTVTKVEFRYQGTHNPATDNCWIYAMANQPSVQSDDDAGNKVIWDDAADGVAYLANNAVFPEVGATKDVGGASGPAWDVDPKGDVETALGVGWFALGFKNSEVTSADMSGFYSKEKTEPAADPPPTLYVEYTVAAEPDPPTNVQATDGVHTDKVVITWTKSDGATKYEVFRDGTPLGELGDVATFDDTGADAPTVTPGDADASDGLYADKVALSLSGQSPNNGTTHTYKVKAGSAEGWSGDSDTDTGYRGVGALTYQWQRSAADSDADYSNIDGATTASYDDTAAPADGSGRYYRCVVSAEGA
ncbi:hypothetical protein ES708_03698 [subsurface metagenome]